MGRRSSVGLGSGSLSVRFWTLPNPSTDLEDNVTQKLAIFCKYYNDVIKQNAKSKIILLST